MRKLLITDTSKVSILKSHDWNSNKFEIVEIILIMFIKEDIYELSVYLGQTYKVL